MEYNINSLILCHGLAQNLIFNLCPYIVENHELSNILFSFYFASNEKLVLYFFVSLTDLLLRPLQMTFAVQNAIPHVDELVREYLVFRGFPKALAAFDTDKRTDRLKGFQVSDYQLAVGARR